ncbi:hypothetical protein [Candidatus Enterococcus ikei]|uniref:Uncharacterized protein n=1 Tax=Candidatus Enterococcus ikei TaxID=2815326 RepID=A0ABS3GWJ4_9ENTE|nr:hypothetical protein [Enterococcus sp. DIV0869a]MBO0439612.1 hypothetical protein [Enterococcus sp. DIV0869a]
MEKEKITVITQNKQPIKQISYQDMYAMKDTLEQLESWTDILMVVDKHFANRKLPLDKKKIARDYYSLSQIFGSFMDDFSTCIDRLETQLDQLMKKEKVKISQ